MGEDDSDFFGVLLLHPAPVHPELPPACFLGLPGCPPALTRVHDGTWDCALAAIKDRTWSTPQPPYLGQIQSAGFEETSPFTELGHKTVASCKKCIPLN